MDSFRELLEALRPEDFVELGPPSGGYHKGLGALVWSLCALAWGPDTPPAQRLAAIKEIADRSLGKAGQANADTAAIPSPYRWHWDNLSQSEQDQLETLLLRVLPQSSDAQQQVEAAKAKVIRLR